MLTIGDCWSANNINPVHGRDCVDGTWGDETQTRQPIFLLEKIHRAVQRMGPIQRALNRSSEIQFGRWVADRNPGMIVEVERRTNGLWLVSQYSWYWDMGGNLHCRRVYYDLMFDVNNFMAGDIPVYGAGMMAPPLGIVEEFIDDLPHFMGVTNKNPICCVYPDLSSGFATCKNPTVNALVESYEYTKSLDVAGKVYDALTDCDEVSEWFDLLTLAINPPHINKTHQSDVVYMDGFHKYADPSMSVQNWMSHAIRPNIAWMLYVCSCIFLDRIRIHQRGNIKKIRRSYGVNEVRSDLVIVEHAQWLRSALRRQAKKYMQAVMEPQVVQHHIHDEYTVLKASIIRHGTFKPSRILEGLK